MTAAVPINSDFSALVVTDDCSFVSFNHQNFSISLKAWQLKSHFFAALAWKGMTGWMNCLTWDARVGKKIPWIPQGRLPLRQAATLLGFLWLWGGSIWAGRLAAAS